MDRRTFLSALLVGVAGTTTGADAFAATARAATTIDSLEFADGASLTTPSGGELTGDSVAVQLEDTAYNEDSDSNGDATIYADSTPIPVVAVDGTVVGIGATLASDDADFRSGNEEFLLNAWDAKLGSGTVLYDEGHDQYNTLRDFSNLANYLETKGDYTVTATQDIAADLPSADGLMLTGPATAFTDSEKQAVVDFVAGGGVVFIHDRSDYSEYDETANLNDVASALSLGFRFNDDQVFDDSSNGGEWYQPTTTQFDTTYDFFADRPGMEIDPDATHAVDVIEVDDGDTVDVRFDSGREEAVRVLGIDTPEKSSNQQYERTEEWEGLEDLSYLADWGAKATDFAKAELGGATVDLSFDDAEEGIFDAYDRLLGYVHYDDSGDGSRDTFYNYQAVVQGYARLYSSSFTNHERFYDAEVDAQTNGRRVWTNSDPANSAEIRNRSVDDTFFPTTASVRTSAGAIDRSRVPVVAESTAEQSGGSVSYASDIPLVGVDEAASVALVGSPLVDESYEQDEGYAVDTSGYENFVLVSNLIDHLSDIDGQVLIDGGHGQFGVDYALSAEDTAYYQRFLEGVGVDFDQVNELSTENLDRGRALVVTSPPDAFTSAELDAVAAFRDDGGTVICVGSSEATRTARRNLNDVASALGSDLRLNDDQITDATNNVNDDPAVPTTTVFDTSYPLFDAYDGTVTADRGTIDVQTVHADAQGDEYDNLNDEYVVFENAGDGDLDLTGYTVTDEVDQQYAFPDGFVLGVGDTVTLHTGSGTDTDTDLYWGSSSPIWNNSGDTVSVYDETGTLVEEYTY
ncbi:nuclease [Halobacteriales archaeon QS_9_67_17]|nr:MAG: nuclease [Halobacteriales archaeon QS_9_67_17]